ncbi:GIY-YIG nuclease family protein [Ignavibacterium sp.]|uniref:GIY-YIG nuclease family protein n=2 Tax=Ignavibacterium sp. TaxID=2651167 RepID=UPI00307CCFFF
MKYFVYILYSENYKKTYVGFTNNLERRLKEHNAGRSKYTKRYSPWRLVYSEEFQNEIEARLKEKYFKSAAGRRKIKKLLLNICPGSSAGYLPDLIRLVMKK